MLWKEIVAPHYWFGILLDTDTIALPVYIWNNNFLIIQDLSTAEDLSLLKCPLTKEFFKDPVTTFDGHNYERSEIEQQTKDFVTNKALKKFMMKVFKEGKWDSKVCSCIPNFGVNSLMKYV